jgi:hypothetical protein
LKVHSRLFRGERLAVLFRAVNVTLRVRVVSPLLLAGILVVAGQAQSASSSNSSTPTPVSANSTPPSDRVVLKVGSMQLTQAQFEQFVSDMESQQGPADLSRKKIAENYASLLALAQQAQANHLDTSPEVLRLLAIDRNQILSNAEYAKLKAEAAPSPQEISAYYSTHLDDYDVVLLRRLFIWKKSPGVKDGRGLSDQEAHAFADQVRQVYATGGDPKKLTYDPNNVVLDNDPLAFQRGEMPGKMDKAAFALTKVGEWTVLDDTPESLVLIQLVQRKRLDLKEVSPQIEKKLQTAKLREEMDELKKTSGIWLDEQYFAPNAKESASSKKPQASAQDKQ